jgi:toxin FitB
LNGFLLDTSVLSAFAPDRPRVLPPLETWIDARSETLFIPTIVVLELQRGIAKLRRAGGSLRASRLDAWLTSMLREYNARTLPVDVDIARIAGDIEDATIAAGRPTGLPDILIAATALSRDLIVLTANARHFDAVGARHLNPFTDDLPS